jgi:hypothetical protein
VNLDRKIKKGFCQEAVSFDVPFLLLAGDIPDRHSESLDATAKSLFNYIPACSFPLPQTKIIPDCEGPALRLLFP